MNCPICGRKMLSYEDTFLCPTCDWEVIYDLKWEHEYKRGLKYDK